MRVRVKVAFGDLILQVKYHGKGSYQFIHKQLSLQLSPPGSCLDIPFTTPSAKHKRRRDRHSESADLNSQQPAKKVARENDKTDTSVILTPQTTPTLDPQNIHDPPLMNSDDDFNSSMSTEGEECLEDEDSELSSGEGKLVFALRPCRVMRLHFSFVWYTFYMPDVLTYEIC